MTGGSHRHAIELNSAKQRLLNSSNKHRPLFDSSKTVGSEQVIEEDTPSGSGKELRVSSAAITSSNKTTVS